MIINLSYLAATPATAMADFNAAATMLDNLITDQITFPIRLRTHQHARVGSRRTSLRAAR